jgi:small subunit ribosomal protein S17
MADEEKTEQEAPEEAPADEAPAEEAPAKDDSPAQPEAAEKEAAPAPAAKAAPAVKSGKGDEPAEVPGPKQIRKLARSTHQGEPNPPQAAEERAAERQAGRRRKAASRGRHRAAGRAKKGEPGVGTPPAERQPGAQKVRLGIVTGSKANKTITVQIESARRHPAYEKIVRRSKALHVHDENNEAGEGDTVRVVETRPMSKTKRWRLIEVVERAK